MANKWSSKDAATKKGRFASTTVVRSAASGKFVTSEGRSAKTQRIGRAMASASKRTGAFEKKK
jgi:hypothetical protein